MLASRQTFFKSADEIKEILFLAVKNGYFKIVANNISKIGDINCVNQFGDTLLHVAARGGWYKIAELLIDHGANVNAVNPEGGMIGVIAASNGSSSANSSEPLYGQTPLHNAVDSQYADVVRLLLCHGADTEIGNYYLYTPLYYTICGSPQIARLLLEAHANPHVPAGQMGGTLLHDAADRGDVEVMKLLIEYGAEINNVKGKYGVGTPLHAAVRSKQIGAVRCLVESGADINITDKEGKTALQYTEYDSMDDLLYYGFNSVIYEIGNSCRLV